MTANTPKVQFVFDIEKEVQYIELLNELGANPLEPEEQHLLDSNEVEFKKNTKELYREEIKEGIEENWKAIEDDYFKMVEEITGHKWLHPQYSVILTSAMLGICNPFEPETDEVAVSFNFPPVVINYIIAHELFHSHYFQIVNRMDNDKLFETELNENCAVLALLFTKIKNLFPFADDVMVKSCIDSHENAAKYFDELHSLWEKRESFDDYLVKSIEVI